MTLTGKVANAAPVGGSAKALKAVDSQPKQQTPWFVMASVRSECDESVSHIQAVMKLADALLKNSASPSRVSKGVQIYFLAERTLTGTATLDSTLMVCPTWKCSGRAIGIITSPISAAKIGDT